MQQLLSSDQSTAFGLTQHPSFGGRGPGPQSYYRSAPHSRSGLNSNYTPIPGPPSGNVWTNVRSNETPFRLDGPALPPANVFHDQRAAMIPHGFPSSLPPYPINIPAPADHIYSSAVSPPGSSSSAANPIWRRGRDETAIADRRKVDALSVLMLTA
ncbi:hypothetical protein BDZ89DRAFT_1159711 [Hymenopellis radicata]|nr:hypothetical protein BDZ89DRAFT_1159711 [Hymenopellis radicata]